MHCTLAKSRTKNIPTRNFAVAVLEENACRWLEAIFNARSEYLRPAGAHNPCFNLKAASVAIAHLSATVLHPTPHSNIIGFSPLRSSQVVLNVIDVWSLIRIVEELHFPRSLSHVSGDAFVLLSDTLLGFREGTVMLGNTLLGGCKEVSQKAGGALDISALIEVAFDEIDEYLGFLCIVLVQLVNQFFKA